MVLVVKQRELRIIGLMNKMMRFFKDKEFSNASWLIGGRIAQMALSLFVGMFTARYLGPENYGLINYGTAYVVFFTALCNLGLNSVIIKDFVDHPDDQGVTIGSVLIMRFVSSMLSSVMIVGIVSIIDKDEPLTIAVVALCSLGAVFHVFETFRFWFQNQYKSKIISIASFCAYGFTAIYKIILLILGKDVRWFAFSTSVDYIVVAIFLFIAYKIHNGPKLKFSINKSKKLLSISYSYILSSLMVAIYGQTDKFMLKQMLGEIEVGYYATATTICGMWSFVLQAIIDSIYPTILRLYTVNMESFNRKNRQLYAIIFYVSFFVSVGMFILGDWGISILYGDDYAPAALPLKIVTWYTAFSYLGVARNAWIVSEGKQRYLKYIYFSAVVINILLNFCLIPIMSASGAALASLITQIFTSIILPMFFKDLRPNAKLMIDAILLKDIFNNKRN